MPQSLLDPSPPDDVAAICNSEADLILADLRALKRRVVEAWHARAVVLTPEEQVRLRDEIRDTCELLSDLTRSA